MKVTPPPVELGRANAIVGGRALRYEVANFAAPLSIKTVVSGTATWRTAAGEYEIGPSGCLVLNDGEEYSIAVDALQPVETFCVFFAHGFVADAHHAATTASAALLDDARDPAPVEFAERLQFDEQLRQLMMQMRDLLSAGRGFDRNESFTLLANRLVQLHTDVSARVTRLPALRESTRDELRRRLERAVALIHGDLAGELALERLAATACLAPFHFHRLFTAFYGETPHRYVTRLRLERAAGLLAGSDRSTVEVAIDCGFESVGSFTTLFRRRVGVPPAAFRKIREARAANGK